MSNYVYAGQAFYHTLVALKGYYREMALDAEVQLDENLVKISPVYAGVVVSPLTTASGIVPMIAPYGGPINGPGQLKVNLGATANTFPLYLYSRPTDPDVYNPGVLPGYGYNGQPPSGSGLPVRPPEHVPVLPRVTGQNLVALAATGSYELETTEFVFDAGNPYLPGQPLRSIYKATADNPLCGQITNRGVTAVTSTSVTYAAFNWGSGAFNTWDTIVGFVSRGVYTNANRQRALAFWSHYIPGGR